MIHLYIDNQPVFLSANNSFEYYKRNPLFTKEGEHTYEIEIDLHVPSNAILYKHINRRDVTLRTTGRSAVIFDGARCLFRGTEIILGATNNTVRIQLISGNSELNYLSGGYMRDLNFGTIDVTLEQARQSLSASYPEFNYVCCPVLVNTDNNLVGTGSKYYNQVDTQNNSQAPTTLANATLRVQPYLLFYVEKTIELLGYTLQRNVLREDYTKKIICVNGLDSNNYADILPDWSVSDFVSHVETLFNVVFLVNPNDKTVDIVRTNTFYEQSTPIYIKTDDILNEYEKNYEQENEVYTNYTNVKYKFPSGIEYYEFADIDPEILKLCTFRTNRLWDFDIDPATFNQMIIYKDQFFGINHVYRVDNSSGTMKFYQHLMYLQRVVNNENDKDFVELEIIPAEIYLRENGTFMKFTVPLARNVLEVSDSSQNTQGLIDYIKDGITEKQAPNHLFIAFYEGYQEYFISVDSSNGESARSDSNHRIPMCHTTPFHHGSYNFGDAALYAVYPDKTVTLELDGEHGLYNSLYKHNLKVNEGTEYNIKFKRKGRIYDPMSVFVIGNQKYYCIEMKYQIDNNEVSDIVEGTFLLLDNKDED